MAKWLASADSRRAGNAYTLLKRCLHLSPFPDAPALLGHVIAQADVHKSLLKRNPSLCKAIERLAGDMEMATAHDQIATDIRLVYNASAMLHILLMGYDEAKAPNDALLAIDTAHKSATTHYLTLASGQVDAFCSYLLEVSRFVKQLALDQSRLVLVELPVGNSLLVKLLVTLLEDLAPTVVIRVSLSRNDSKRAGITRTELLEEKIAEANIQPNEIIIYADEWITGVNFNAICSILRKVVPSDTFLLPAAVLTDSASGYARYDTFRKDHDKLVGQWGTFGQSFRRTLPPLPSSIEGQYFFWSERDRMAGYRKMQVHGAVFSSLEASIQELRSDDKALLAASQITLGDLAKEKDLPGSPRQGIAAMRAIFEDSYLDYLECREELEQCGEEFAGGGEAEDIDEAVSPLMAIYGRLLNNRKAKVCVCLAMAYAERIGSLDPTDRYYFPGHAPVLIELDGPSARTHELTMDFLTKKLQSISEA